ncbi:MAG: MMPL family transporter [Candidatus Marinimicrobia bacterium]|nr:MMPL family transporter [Candidatus Neomarinimicrobiota bacterium]
MIRAIVDFDLKYPRTIIAFSILLTLLMGWNIPKMQLEPDVKALMPQDFEIITSMKEMEDTFGGNDLVVVSLTSENIFSPGTLEKIEAMTAEIETLATVDQVTSITNVPDVQGTPDGFEVRELIEDFPVNESQIDSLKKQIAGNKMIYGTLVSTDFKKAGIIAFLNVASHENTDKEIYQTFMAIKHKYEGPEQIHIAGLPITRREVSTTMTSDMKKLFPYGIILMILLLVFSFRSWMGTFLPFVVVIMSIVFTVGLMVLFHVKMTVVEMMIPVMLIAIANSYSIQIVTQYFVEYIRNPKADKDSLIRLILSYLTTPVFLSGFTTLIGFLSLQSHILPPAKHLGLFCACGTTIAFIFSLTFIPAALKLLDFPMILKTSTESSDKTSRFLVGWGHIFVRFRKPFLIFCLLAIIAISTGIARIIVDTNPVAYWKKSSEIRQSNDVIDRNFGGSSTLSILAKGDIKDPEFLKKIENLCAFLEKQPAVTRANSIVDQLKRMNQAFHGDSSQYNVIPATNEEVAQYLFLYSLTGNTKDLDRFVDYDYTQAQILARVNDSGSKVSYKLYTDTKDYIAKNLGTENFPSVSGMAPLIGVLSELIIDGQIRSLLLSIISVFLIVAVFFRSLTAGLISIIPLSGAVLCLFGIMGYIGITLNMATAMLSSIMIGVGIDYTIHFMYRFRLEAQKGADAENAVIRTLTTSGKGIIYNATSVIVGFMVLMLSGFEPIYFFGFLIVVSITGCLLGALTILPALLVWIRPAFVFGKRSTR